MVGDIVVQSDNSSAFRIGSSIVLGYGRWLFHRKHRRLVVVTPRRQISTAMESSILWGRRKGQVCLGVLGFFAIKMLGGDERGTRLEPMRIWIWPCRAIAIWSRDSYASSWPKMVNIYRQSVWFDYAGRFEWRFLVDLTIGEADRRSGWRFLKSTIARTSIYFKVMPTWICCLPIGSEGMGDFDPCGLLGNLGDLTEHTKLHVRCRRGMSQTDASLSGFRNPAIKSPSFGVVPVGFAETTVVWA